MQVRAYLYMRFSSAEQADGDSLDRQRTLAEDYISQHPERGLLLVEDPVFVDEGISSFAGQNREPGRALHRFLQAVETGQIPAGSVLMVESLDRLSRQQVIEAQRLLLDLLVRDISVVVTSPSERREFSRRSGMTDLIIGLANMERANKESEVKSDRVRSAWKKKRGAASDVKLTSRCPSWLKLSDDRKSFTVIEDKAQIVRRIFDLAESMGLHGIARVLNADRVPPFQPKSDGWHDSTIAKIVTGPAAIGTYQPHEKHRESGRRVPVGPPLVGYYPAIVDEALYYRVQALRSSRKVVGAGRKGVGFTNLFTGIARCAVCGSPMVLVRKGLRGGTYLVCSSARRGLGCPYNSAPYHHCESGFLEECRRIDVSTLLPGKVDQSDSTRLRKELAAVVGEAAQKRSIIQKMMASIEANGGEIPRAIADQMVEYEDRLEDLQQQSDFLSAELALADANAHQVAGLQSNFFEFVRLLKSGSEADRYTLRSRFNALLKVALTSIVVGPADPDLAEVMNKLLEAAEDAMVRDHPDTHARAVREGLVLYPRVQGAVRSFKVTYKNGSVIELLIDAHGPLGARLMHSAESRAEAERRGFLWVADVDWRIVLGRGGHEPKARPRRDASGKFALSSGVTPVA